MTNKIKRILCVGIAFVTLLSVAAVAAPDESAEADNSVAVDETSDVTAEQGAQFICESESIAMYADIATGGFYILDKRSGEKWQSSVTEFENDTYTKGTARGNIRSEIILNYVYAEDATSSNSEEIANSYSESVSCGLVDVKRLENGIKVSYTFDFLQTVVPVEYILENGALKATVKYDEIKQHKDFLITGIRVLPYFGAANWDETGYMLVPDGSGAVINFNQAITDDVYEKDIYVDSPVNADEKVQYTQTENIYLPVFGMVKSHGAVLGIVSSGAENSAILASARTSTCGYNVASAKWKIRVNYPETMFDTTFGNKRQLNRWVVTVNKGAVYSIEYRFIEAGATYVELANEYRGYLSENAMLPDEEKLLTPSFNVDVYGAVDTVKNFLGFSYKKAKALTTYEEAAKIIKELQKAGIKNVSARYIGWGNNGIVNKKLPTKMKTVGCLGKASQLDSLIELANGENVNLTLDVDFVYSTKAKKKAAIRNAFNNPIYQYDFYRSNFSRRLDRDGFRLATPDTIKEAFEKYLSSSKTDYLDLSLGNLGTLCYSDLSPNSTVLKSEMKQTVLGLFEAAKEKGAKLTFEAANDYALPFADKIVSVPLSSGGYDLFDKSVPFYQLVLHGSIAIASEPIIQSANPQVAFLKAVETGTELTYAGIYAHASELTETEYDHLYSSTYTWWLEEAAVRYGEYQPLLEKIYDRSIVSHSEIGDNVIRAGYDNGITVTVNYNKFDVTVDGVTVSAMDYIVGGVE